MLYFKTIIDTNKDGIFNSFDKKYLWQFDIVKKEKIEKVFDDNFINKFKNLYIK